LTVYSRYQAIPSGIIGFTLSWPNNDVQNAVLHGERLATLLSDLFRANIELGLPRSPPAPRLMTAAVPHVPLPATPPSAPAVPEGRKPEDNSSLGTGFFVSPEGHIVTNSHVVKDCSFVQVTFGLAPKMAGRIMAHDAANDLALIKIEMHPTAFASLRSGVRLGEGVAAFWISTRRFAGDKREFHARQCHRRGRIRRRHAHPTNFGARTARKQRRATSRL
jgi:serine protease Do